MELNGVNSAYASYEAASISSKATASKTTTTKSGETTKTSAAYSESGATYEASGTSNIKASKTDRAAIIEKLKADADNRTQQFKSLVTQMFQKQGITIGTTDDMWKVLAGGNFTADADTIAQAKEDISENGYWGVSQTSDRIFSFATALAGDDEEMMTKMQEAVKKGFSEATKSWGKELPGISNDTYNSVMKKFDDYFKSKETTSTEE